MRPPLDLPFHLRMAALLLGAMLLEHFATANLPGWSSPRIGLIPFAVGLAWVAQATWHHHRTAAAKLQRLEHELHDLTERFDELAATRPSARHRPGHR